MHSIHTTRGFIVGSRPYADAGRVLTIFTRDFGLIYATAQGIRLEKSKLRYYTQEYSFGAYSLVRGKEFWRLTSANGESQDLRFTIHDLRSEHKELIARIALLLRRLLQGEEPHPELFDIVFECWKFLVGHLTVGLIVDMAGGSIKMLGEPNEDIISMRENLNDGTISMYEKLNDEEMRTLESLVVARMLSALGYIGEVAGISDRLRSIEITPELLRALSSQRTILNQHINKALKESML